MTSENILSGLCQLEGALTRVPLSDQLNRLGFPDMKSQAVLSLFNCAGTVRGNGYKGSQYRRAFVVSTFIASLVLFQKHLPMSQISRCDWRCLVLLVGTGDTFSTVLSLLPVQ